MKGAVRDAATLGTGPGDHAVAISEDWGPAALHPVGALSPDVGRPVRRGGGPSPYGPTKVRAEALGEGVPDSLYAEVDLDRTYPRQGMDVAEARPRFVELTERTRRNDSGRVTAPPSGRRANDRAYAIR